MSELETLSRMPDLSKAIGKLEKHMLTREQVSCPVTHQFSPGLYIRKVEIPAGTFAVGHHQNFEHMNLFLKGSVTILKDDGTTERITAPMMFTGKPGRKIGFIHDDMVWLNIYPTNETDVEKLEATFLTKSEAFESEVTEKKLKLLTCGLDHEDYRQALAEFGFTEEIARAQSENTDDMTELPPGGYKIKVADSAIEGKGLFATADLEEFEIIAPARIDMKRTIAGRFSNHSANPNARMVEGLDGNIFLQAIKPIAGCRGGFDGEEITTNYRESLALTRKIGDIQCQE